MSITAKILEYENGELGTWEVILLFSALIASGQAFTLQGHYGRSANNLIEAGFINADGEITLKARKELNNEIPN